MRLRDTVEKSFLSYLRKHHMVENGETVLLGVSGGADSVCLLLLMQQVREQLGISLQVVHVNHGIRQTAARDEEFVKNLCKKLQVPFQAEHVDIPKLAKEQSCSLEEAGRAERYRIFTEAAKTCGATRIAVAHHANDRAETLLFHLFRGTGVKGMGSIRPVRGNIIRPLLFMERKEIEAYLEELGQEYVTDETNLSDAYTRNKIRHNIIEYAEQEICTGAAAHLCHAAQQMSEIEDYLAGEVEKAKAQVAQKSEEGYRLRITEFSGLHPVIRSLLIRNLLLELSPEQKDIASIHVEEVIALCHKETGKQVSLPFRILAARSYDRLVLQKSEEQKGAYEQEISLETLGSAPVRYEINGNVFGICVREYREEAEIPENQYTKWLDYDKINSAVLRTRQTGDYLMIRSQNGESCHKSLKEYLIGQKVSRLQRDRLVLLADKNHILWVVGYRISEDCKVGKTTKRILEITMNNSEENQDGRTC